MSTKEYRYSDSSLLTGDVPRQGLSDFDHQLQEKWDRFMELGHFRYEVKKNGPLTRVIPGKFDVRNILLALFRGVVKYV